MQDTDIEGVEQPEKTLAYSHIKRKIAILLASLLMFTALLLVTSILFYIFVPDGDTWWIWVVWVIWSIIFTIGAVETFNSVRQYQALRLAKSSYVTFMDENLLETTRQAHVHAEVQSPESAELQ